MEYQLMCTSDVHFQLFKLEKYCTPSLFLLRFKLKHPAVLVCFVKLKIFVLDPELKRSEGEIGQNEDQQVKKKDKSERNKQSETNPSKNKKVGEQ
jgi:hypothetical protein